MSDWYELIGQTPVKIEIDWDDPASFAKLRYMDSPEYLKSRRVAETIVLGVRVSTVFLGLDHGYFGPPVLFESMAFWPGEHWEEQDRCGVEWSEAEDMHARMCQYVSTVRARLAWIKRTWSECWYEARTDWARRWKHDIRSIPLSAEDSMFATMREMMAWDE